MYLPVAIFICLAILKGIVIHGTNLTKSGSALTYYSRFDDVMYPTAHNTIGIPRRLSLDACAELCLSRSFITPGRNRVSNITMLSKTNETKDNTFGHENQSDIPFILDKPTGQPITIDEVVTCQAFEYLVSLGYCILLNTSAAVDNYGYKSLKSAVGTTYFELDKEKFTDCDYNGCLNGATCSPHLNHHGYICKCAEGYCGKHCEQRTSPCSRSPCLFGGFCEEHGLTFKCNCPNGTTGNMCETFMGECFKTPCVNGICSPITSGLGYKCACAIGFTGNNCEYEINECFSSPCRNGHCQDLIGGYKCVCQPSFTGRHCEIDHHLAECSGLVCQYGTCAINESGSFCQCFPGFTGRLCDTDINDCQAVPCAHGICKDHVNSYSCLCHHGYAGRHCDISLIDPCKHSPCIHGYCSVDTTGYKCECEHGYTGTHCESDRLSCDINCVHGLCIDTNDKIQTCSCSPEYPGRFCNVLNKSNKTHSLVQGNKSSLVTPSSSPNIVSINIEQSSIERTTKPLSTSLSHIHNTSPSNVPLTTKTYPYNLGTVSIKNSTAVVALPATSGQNITVPNLIHSSIVSNIIKSYSSTSMNNVTFSTTHSPETTWDPLNSLPILSKTWSHLNIWSHTPSTPTNHFAVSTMEGTTQKNPTTTYTQPRRRISLSNQDTVKHTKTLPHTTMSYSQSDRMSSAGSGLSYGEKIFSKIHGTSVSYINSRTYNIEPSVAIHKTRFTTNNLGSKTTLKIANVKTKPLIQTSSNTRLVPKTTETPMSATTPTMSTTFRGPLSLTSGHNYNLLQSTIANDWWRSRSNNNQGTMVSMVPYPTTPIQNQNDNVNDVSEVNDVITIESTFIGALFVTLLIVTGLGVYLFYKKTRRGTIYITSPELPTKLGETSVKKRYSSRGIHTELKSGQLFQPRYVSSEFCRRNATNSESWDYDDVESPILSVSPRVRTIDLKKGNSHVTLPRGHGVVSSSNPNETFMQSYRSFDEVDNDISFSGDENPFFEKPDGTIGLNLSTRDHSCNQEKIDVYLQDILKRNQHTPYPIPGTRKSVYYITGTSDGKSEV